jgi:hypothetical protein
MLASIYENFFNMKKCSRSFMTFLSNAREYVLIFCQKWKNAREHFFGEHFANPPFVDVYTQNTPPYHRPCVAVFFAYPLSGKTNSVLFIFIPICLLFISLPVVHIKFVKVTQCTLCALLSVPYTKIYMRLKTKIYMSRLCDWTQIFSQNRLINQ